MANHQARKRFGQNFLVDQSVIDSIIRAIAPQRSDRMIEIGPGLSALTAPLLDRLDHLTAIEIDRDLAARLTQKYPADRLTVVNEDVLQIDFSQFGSGLRIVGNLPYNISSPLLFALTNHAEQVIDQHFMLQREVVDRMVADPGSGDYSRLSVMLQSRWRMHKLFDVSPDAFDPPPRVTSSIVRMIPLGADRLRAVNEDLFSRLVQKAFSQRRKMLRGVLGEWTSLIPWSDLGVEPTWRAEQVSVAGFIGMSDALSAAGVV
ncbi:16S rRNA (adenine(1518)-N(6)/adenine(1519)-N(6))-dimethyltransferase RsmA [Orrella sp. NBD-18]|uniref:Ribosomal RNA small subunit methyltransferase A n=1 Tax=Sheuella amnicola TaxID=2707330 RepID=A0A6B2R454_9BURK|nr:16S rRNA (adenine(1518)-N(6)/adenine(1519)-N(6))-dimethyltransferase RsmA [Sheuella amnicola]NDY83777.1 16S rRNA (adenine(1518)-N(6)/adenine(1519)-N(6))-dimethyltransferase RsmA [Sheuella amnicola]HBI82333.1 16S rRNA (adenine(1518)-N(6)/adenine(1519)-N(6))-dimethyltransferase [Alcaligenaceae bacterium]